MGFVFLDKKMIIGGTVLVISVFVVGVLIGYFGRGGLKDETHGQAEAGGSSKFNPGKSSRSSRNLMGTFQSEQDMIEKLLQDIDGNDIREYLRVLTNEPHIAALKRDKYLTNWIKENWEESGMDKVFLTDYELYLSWPNQTNPNKIFLKDSNGEIQFTSKHKEEELRPGDDSPNFVHAFNGYAPAGDVEGELIYVNYARVEDLKELEDMGVSVEGKICLARYGKIYRGNKVQNCQHKGAIGVIMYTDPKEVAVQGTTPDKVYPNSIFLPGSGVQRGSTFVGDGDPLTPNWAAVDNAYREDPEDVEGLPKIPAQPIGYDDARVLLEKMGGKESPDGWKGKLEGIEYRIGDEWKPEYQGWRVQIKTNNYFGNAKSSNVIGIINGAVEPDRYVLLSNHRDAWGYGAIDPSSGTANLMVVAKMLGEMRKKGWKPRRSIVFCSWAAEEYGLLGSYEWVYQKINKITNRAVGVLNTDICATGPILKTQASPLLREVVLDGVRHSSDPTRRGPRSGSYFPDDKSSGRERSYYEFWEEWYNQDNKSGTKLKPKIPLLGSGSDHAPFAFYAGIPSINHRFKDDTKKYKGVGQYPTYHTGYETFYLVDKIIDPGFEIHRTCSQSSIRMLLNMADSEILPYELTYVPLEMQKALDNFQKKNVSKLLEDNGATLKYVQEAVTDFKKATEDYMEMLKNLDTKDRLKLRIVNDQMMQLERVFIIPGGIPGREGTRHAIFAPAKFNAYGSSAFPGIGDLLHEIEKLEGIELKQRWRSIKKHVSDLMIMIRSATEFLQEVDII